MNPLDLQVKHSICWKIPVLFSLTLRESTKGLIKILTKILLNRLTTIPLALKETVKAHPRHLGSNCHFLLLITTATTTASIRWIQAMANNSRISWRPKVVGNSLNQIKTLIISGLVWCPKDIIRTMQTASLKDLASLEQLQMISTFEVFKRVYEREIWVNISHNIIKLNNYCVCVCFF